MSCEVYNNVFILTIYRNYTIFDEQRGITNEHQKGHTICMYIYIHIERDGGMRNDCETFAVPHRKPLFTCILFLQFAPRINRHDAILYFFFFFQQCHMRV